MLRPTFTQSIMTRTLATLVVVGVVLTCVINTLLWFRTYHHQQQAVSTFLADELTYVQDYLTSNQLLDDNHQVTDVLATALNRHNIIAARLRRPDGTSISIGDWRHKSINPDAIINLPAENELASTVSHIPINLNGISVVNLPFQNENQNWTLTVRIDTSPLWASQTKNQWLYFFVTCVCAIIFVITTYFVVRRWIMQPLKLLNKLIQQQAPANSYVRLASNNNFELGQLAASIASMQQRYDEDNQSLIACKTTHQQLFKQAPAALLQIDLAGKILNANRYAADLLQVKDVQSLTDRNTLAFIDPRDKPKFFEAIERLARQDSCKCDIRLIAQDSDTPIEALIEAAGDFDEMGNLISARLALRDIGHTNDLHRQLQAKTQLMNMVVDHMSDGILLVNQDNQIVAVNQQLCRLLHRPADQLQGQACNHTSLWDRLGIIDHEVFLQQIRRIESDTERAAQERFQSSHGSYLIQGVPIRDGLGKQQARLWIISEITTQEQNSRLVTQQNQRLATVKHFADELAKAKTADHLLEITVRQMHNFFNVEAVGIAIRNNQPNHRSKQLVYRDDRYCELKSERKLIHAIESGLMPEIFASPDFAYWPDLDLSKGFWSNNTHRSSWRSTFTSCNFTSLAVGPLIDNVGATQGLIWCAQRSGERFERHEMLLIEMITPIIEARLELVQLRESLQNIDLVDPVTALPNQQQFLHAAEHFDHATNSEWSLLILDVDHYDRVQQTLGRGTANDLLISITTLLQNTTRRNCFISRYAESTFAILVPDIEQSRIRSIAERLRDRLASTTVQLPEGQSIATSFSIGVTFSHLDGPSIPQMLALAIARTGTARTHGRNCIVDHDGLISSLAS